jgi:hypothetical protein
VVELTPRRRKDAMLPDPRDNAYDDEPECLDADHGGCNGEVEYRPAMSSTGRSFPRCALHFEWRLEQQREIEARYPVHAPRDFDPLACGERWNEDY